MKNLNKSLRIIALTVSLAALSFSLSNIVAQSGPFLVEDKIESDPVVTKYAYVKANVDFAHFEKVTTEAKAHRKDRLIDFQTFVAYSKDSSTIILDTRSKRQFDKMHIEGAVHINFSDFTQDYLAEMIPDTNTRILIYCNNNFKQEPLFADSFPGKGFVPPSTDLNLVDPNTINTLALNIPTYINLYGYNYKNVYELDELVSSTHINLKLQGTDAPVRFYESN